MVCYHASEYPVRRRCMAATPNPVARTPPLDANGVRYREKLGRRDGVSWASAEAFCNSVSCLAAIYSPPYGGLPECQIKDVVVVIESDFSKGKNAIRPLSTVGPQRWTRRSLGRFEQRDEMGFVNPNSKKAGC